MEKRIEKRMKPLSEVPPIALGGQAIDGGYLILTEEEKEELISREPQAMPFIRHYMMGKDFIDSLLKMDGMSQSEKMNNDRLGQRIESMYFGLL